MLGPNYVVKGPFPVPEKLTDALQAKAWHAADRFASIYKAVSWQWSHCGRCYIPSSIDLHKLLTDMLKFLRSELAKMESRNLGEVVESYSTGGLHVRAVWSDYEESEDGQQFPDFEFVFTDSPTLYVDSTGEESLP